MQVLGFLTTALVHVHTGRGTQPARDAEMLAASHGDAVTN